MDATRKLNTVTLANTPAERLGKADLPSLMDYVLVALSNEMIGQSNTSIGQMYNVETLTARKEKWWKVHRFSRWNIPIVMWWIWQQMMNYIKQELLQPTHWYRDISRGMIYESGTDKKHVFHFPP